jgi:hypothetical protein
MTACGFQLARCLEGAEGAEAHDRNWLLQVPTSLDGRKREPVKEPHASARLTGFDYGLNVQYQLTIVTGTRRLCSPSPERSRNRDNPRLGSS